jgi:hypothetical protein
MTTLRSLLDGFLSYAKDSRIEIYNEFSLQHELGVFLRTQLPGCRIQFERNVLYFNNYKNEFIKREIDIAVFSPDKADLKMAIELKFPRNGQIPEQMFSFCKDIAFVEELIDAGFKETGLLIFVDSHLFYQGPKEGIYAHFRGHEPITGTIKKPTGKKDKYVNIKGNYRIDWFDLNTQIKYALVTVLNG